MASIFFYIAIESFHDVYDVTFVVRLFSLYVFIDDNFLVLVLVLVIYFFWTLFLCLLFASFPFLHNGRSKEFHHQGFRVPLHFNATPLLSFVLLYLRYYAMGHIYFAFYLFQLVERWAAQLSLPNDRKTPHHSTETEALQPPSLVLTLPLSRCHPLTSVRVS